MIDAMGAIYLPEQDLLIVADLHFEKGSFLSQHFSPLPRYDSRATLDKLNKLQVRYHPQTILCAGDSFHDSQSVDRLASEDFTQLTELIERVSQWVWVLGNHDPDIPVSVPGLVVDQWHIKLQSGLQVVCRHESIDDGSAEIIGHFHPKGRFTLSGRLFGGKCLLISKRRIIMPSMGQYTGGLDINDDAILTLIPESARQAYLLYQGKVFALPKGS